MSVVTEITIVDHLNVTSRPGLVTRPGAMREGSRPDLRHHREGPAPGPSMVLILWSIRDQHVLWIRLRIPSLLLVIIIIITRGLRSTTGPCPLHLVLRSTTGPCPSSIITVDMRKTLRTIRGQLMCPEERLTLTTAVPDQPERRTITVIQSPAHPASQDDGKCDGPSRGCRLSYRWRLGKACRLGSCCRPGRGWRLRRGCRPGKTWQLGSCRLGKGSQPSRTEGSSSDDSSKVADTSLARTWSRDFFWGWEWFFRHCPDRLIRLVCWTLCQWTLMHRRMDTVMPAPENQDRPPVERRFVDFNVQNWRIAGACQKVQDSSKKMQRFWWVQELHALQIARKKIFIIWVST